MDSPAWKPDEIDEFLQDWPAMNKEIDRYYEVFFNAENALTSEHRAPTKEEIAAYVTAARDVINIFHEKISFLRKDVFYGDNCKKIVATYLDFIRVVKPDNHEVFDRIDNKVWGLQCRLVFQEVAPTRSWGWLWGFLILCCCT
ncbi:hypothetical protein L484_017189 [Morus notabilis]|uniref:Uncharacterized protein n=1 Tax=Morus notabilis TaxID=981085 RepID=W9QVF1_9ROSA|nr:hypothetical protein L484_017189 [Morus notabilis]